MPIFKPISVNEDDYDESSVELALRESGISPASLEHEGEILPPLAPSENLDESKFRNILNRNGASVAQASRTIAHIMTNGRYENTQLKAAELVLDLQGIRDKEGKLQKQAVFNFVINDGSVNIQNIFAPVRSSTSLSSED